MGEINRNIYSIIKENSVLYPHNTLVSINNEEITYEAFIKDVDSIAHTLVNLGVCPNQKIGIIMPNSVLWYKKNILGCSKNRCSAGSFRSADRTVGNGKAYDAGGH